MAKAHTYIPMKHSQPPRRMWNQSKKKKVQEFEWKSDIFEFNNQNNEHKHDFFVWECKQQLIELKAEQQ